MKTYNTICGIICIILLIEAMIVANTRDNEPQPTEIGPVQEVIPAPIIEPAPEPAMATEPTQPVEPNTTEDSPKEPTKETPTPQVHHSNPTDTPSSARYPLTDYERDIVARVVMSESQGEPYQGQMAVAQCILNTAEAKGIRPDAVVLSPGQYASPANSASDGVKQAVSAVFDQGLTATPEPIRYFYAPKYCTSEWHENSLQYVITIGGHRFFK